MARYTEREEEAHDTTIRNTANNRAKTMRNNQNANQWVSRRKLLLIDVQEVARRLAMSEESVLRLTAAGTLPQPIIIGNEAARWRTEDIRAWVNAGCPDRGLAMQRTP